MIIDTVFILGHIRFTMMRFFDGENVKDEDFELYIVVNNHKLYKMGFMIHNKIKREPAYLGEELATRLQAFMMRNIYYLKNKKHNAVEMFEVIYHNGECGLISIYIQRVPDNKRIIINDLQYKREVDIGKREKEMLEYIRDAGEEGLSLTDVTLKFKAVPKTLRKNILKSLEDSKKIRYTFDTSGGRQKKIYHFNYE